MCPKLSITDSWTGRMNEELVSDFESPEGGQHVTHMLAIHMCGTCTKKQRSPTQKRPGLHLLKDSKD